MLQRLMRKLCKVKRNTVYLGPRKCSLFIKVRFIEIGLYVYVSFTLTVWVWVLSASLLDESLRFWEEMHSLWLWCESEKLKPWCQKLHYLCLSFFLIISPFQQNKSYCIVISNVLLALFKTSLNKNGLLLNRSSCLKVFNKTAAVKTLLKFTGKHLQWSSFSLTLQSFIFLLSHISFRVPCLR